MCRFYRINYYSSTVVSITGPMGSWSLVRRTTPVCGGVVRGAYRGVVLETDSRLLLYSVLHRLQSYRTTVYKPTGIFNCCLFRGYPYTGCTDYPSDRKVTVVIYYPYAIAESSGYCKPETAFCIGTTVCPRQQDEQDISLITV